MLRFESMSQLRGSISPEVRIEGDSEPRSATDVYKQLQKQAGNGSKQVLEDTFLATWQRMGGPPLEPQMLFHPERKWRFDFAVKGKKIAFEIQGGIYAAQSGHRSFEGVQRDYEKLNEAQLWGWQVFQVTSRMMKSPTVMQQFIDFCRR